MSSRIAEDSSVTRGERSIKLNDKTAVITGASSGLGKALALALAREGMQLALAARGEQGLSATAAEAERLGSRAIAVRTDVVDPAQCRALIDQAAQTFGTIDLLVLNAGASMWARFDQVTDLSLFRKLMETNYLGAVYCVHPALSHLKQSRGSIVAILSLQAVIGAPNHTGYTASKHALYGFLDSLEVEIGEEVHILRVLPGWIRGTRLRSRAFKADGTPVGSAAPHRRHAVTLEECTEKILQAIRQKRRMIYIPSKLKFLPWLKLAAPGRLKAMIKKAVEEEER